MGFFLTIWTRPITNDAWKVWFKNQNVRLHRHSSGFLTDGFACIRKRKRIRSHLAASQLCSVVIVLIPIFQEEIVVVYAITKLARKLEKKDIHVGKVLCLGIRWGIVKRRKRSALLSVEPFAVSRIWMRRRWVKNLE